jgi:flagellar P-ring protein precursor FlgI
MKKMKKLLNLITILMIVTGMTASQLSAFAAPLRIKDIAHVKGVRNNQLVGYGIVVGLPGTGDNSRSTQITNQQLLQNLGTVIQQSNYIQKGSSAAVIVTATVPPFAKNGDTIDLTVSTMADAKSLEGGVLVQTQLRAPNGEIVAVGQGPLSVGGVSKESNGSSARTSITTTGRVPNGGIVERDINTQIGETDTLTLSLEKTDYTLASRIASKINQEVSSAKAVDGTSIRVTIPQKFLDDRIAFLSILENMTIDSTKEKAKIVVNERTGTVVIGSEVKLLPAAVAHGSITVTVQTNNMISQPEPFSGGQTAAVSNSTVSVNKQSGSLITMPANSTLNDLVRALNTIGVTPVDLISIMQALREAGSLQAEIQII